MYISVNAIENKKVTVEQERKIEGGNEGKNEAREMEWQIISLNKNQGLNDHI